VSSFKSKKTVLHNKSLAQNKNRIKKEKEKQEKNIIQKIHKKVNNNLKLKEVFNLSLLLQNLPKAVYLKTFESIRSCIKIMTKVTLI
jgi:hypothetical protein